MYNVRTPLYYVAVKTSDLIECPQLGDGGSLLVPYRHLYRHTVRRWDLPRVALARGFLSRSEW
jgi:hypothetical protein